MEETKNEGILTSLGLQVMHSPVASSLIPLGHCPNSGSKGSHPSPLSLGTWPSVQLVHLLLINASPRSQVGGSGLPGLRRGGRV